MNNTDGAYLIVAVLFYLVGLPFIIVGSVAILTGNSSLMRAMLPSGLGIASLCFLILCLGIKIDGCH